MRRPDVQAIAISTPNAFHAEQAVAALEAGKHVLVQKPVALSAADVARVLDAARRAARVLLVDYSYRYLATWQKLMELLPTIGRVTAVRGAFHNIYGPGKAWFFDRSLSGGGALMDLGVHLLDLVLHALRPARTQVQEATFGFERGYAVEDAARVRFACDGVPAEIEASWQAERTETDIRLEVAGARGTLVWRNIAGSFFHFRTELDGLTQLDRETTLRADTLRVFRAAVAGGGADPPDVRVYDLLAQAYDRA
jgi:predicted dehydrogenase